MSLSKQQMLGAVGAGVFVLCAGVLGYMLYSAWAEKGEAEQTLQGQTDAFRRYNEAAVFPSKASIASVKSNGTSYAAWHESAVAFASRGDRAFPPESPSIFKQRLQSEVRRMVALNGGVDGKIAAPTFLFGFEQFLGEGGVLPKNEEVPLLAAQLDTIAHVVDIFAEAGILEVKAVRRIAVQPDAEKEASARPKRKNARKAAPKAEAEGPKETCLKYAFEFTTRPAALVAVLNGLTASERFMTVKDLSFHQTADVISDRLSAIEAAAQKAAGGRPASARRRGRRGAADADAASGAAKADPLVVDPELDAPILVTFTLEVRDFGRAAAAAATSTEASAEKQKEGGE